jgi:acyl-CoA thioester hydrolase
MFTWPIRVYYEDTDLGGIVYYANYLRFMERARTEWLRALGFDQTDLWRNRQMLFIITSAEVRYRRPARFDDMLCVTAELEAHRHTTVTFRQHVYRDAKRDELLVEGRVQAACVAADTFRPRAIPGELFAAMERD